MMRSTPSVVLPKRRPHAITLKRQASATTRACPACISGKTSRIVLGVTVVMLHRSLVSDSDRDRFSLFAAVSGRALFCKVGEESAQLFDLGFFEGEGFACMDAVFEI